MKSFLLIVAICGCAQLCLAQTTPVQNQRPQLIPQPKSVQFGEGHFVLKSRSTWEYRGPIRDEQLIEAATAITSGKVRFKKTGDSLFVLQVGSRRVDLPSAGNLPKWASDPEGYQLNVSQRGVVILASTAQGAFYGLQTLKQLLMSSGDQRSCPVVVIEDWPSMRFRGVHWFPSASGVDMHSKLIENVFGALKFNASVIQCEAARWDSHPAIAATNSISKADLQKLVRLCRNSYLEPIPLINVPGHAEWIFRNEQNLDFCEDPQTPYAYCINHPKSFQFFQDIAGECLDVFKPKYFHIGHDEIAMRGRFPNPECPRCRERNMTELMTGHANRLSDWLSQRGVETMIWGDMLLGPGEANDATHAKSVADANERRQRLSRKITITDWHYAPKSDARSFELFRQLGFNTIACSWYQPANIHALAGAAQTSGAAGLLQTTWMGYFPDEKQLKLASEQFTAFVLAADYAWSGRAEPPAQLEYDAKEIFMKLYGGVQ